MRKRFGAAIGLAAVAVVLTVSAALADWGWGGTGGSPGGGSNDGSYGTCMDWWCF